MWQASGVVPEPEHSRTCFRVVVFVRRPDRLVWQVAIELEFERLPLLSLSIMAANGSSMNTANIITALGNAFKDPSGAALPNERLAAVLLQNMNQLNDLAKQGKLNQQQIMQVRS